MAQPPASGPTDHGATVAVCPGSFDPLTLGHVDIIERAARLYGRVIVAVLVNPDKQPWFSVDERLAIIRDVFRGHAHVEAAAFDGLLVDYASAAGASVIIRGLRTAADFEYESQRARMNRHLSPRLETTFLLPAEPYAFISSTLIKEVFSLGGSIEGLVPPVVEARLNARRPARPLPHARPT